MGSIKGEIAERVMAGRPLDHIPVIDMHGHLGTSGEYYYVPRNSEEEVVAYLDRFGVDHMVAFAFTLSSDVRVGNDHVLSRAESRPDRFSALVALHAGFPDDWLDLLEAGRKRGARGIKLISAYQRVAEAKLDWSPVLDYARDKGWMVLNHQWASAERLIDYARRYPEIAFVIGHGFNALPAAVEACRNVYQCTCAHWVNHRWSIGNMAREFPPEQILFGSDALDLDLGTAIGPIALTDIPEELKEMILGGNAVRLADRMGWALRH